MDFFERFTGRRIRRAAAVAAGLLLLWALVGFLVLPPVLRPIVERKIGEALHRKAMLRGMSINPLALSVTLKGLEVRDRDGTGPFLSFESLYVNAEAASVLRRGPVLRAVTLVKPALTLVRNADGRYNLQDLLEEFSTPKAKDDEPLRFSLNNLLLEDGSVDFDDRPKHTKHAVRDLRIGIPFLSNIPSKVEITTEPVFEAKVNGAPFALRGKSKPFSETRETTVNLDLDNVDLPFYLAYVPANTPSKLTSARLDAKVAFSFTQPPAGRPVLVVSGTAGLRKVVLSFASPAVDVVLSEATVALEGLSTEPGKHAALRVSAKGDAGEVKMDDRNAGRPARYALTKSDVLLENISMAEGSKGTLSVRFGVDGKGAASARGAVGFKPMFADLRVDVKDVDLVPIQAYVLQDLRLDLARGTVGAAGSLAIHEDTAGKASVVYAGNALVANLVAVDESTKLDFVKWGTFSAIGMKAGYNPLFLEVKQLAAVGLACDVAIEEDGTMNLRRIAGVPTPKDDGEDVEAGSGEAIPAPAPGGTNSRTAMPIRIDELTLQGGRIGLADRFVKPNYSATLGDLGGRVSGLSSADGTVATLDLRGSLAGHSPLQVSGAINPLAAAQFADVKASFRDIDLPSFTPYSGKYAGYAIAGGSLTLEVAYKLENRKLSASNRFLVNQFNFGEKVESKEATKLPVRLAVSLLKDKDGLIDLDLPIEGSLDDPKFRIGKVIWKVLGNLIAKAATAPFALLGKLLGGKGEEYASVDFADGVATLDEAAKKKLDALAKALKDRPALSLQATGRVSGDKDLEGLRSLRVERKIKAQKFLDVAKKGGAPAGADDVVVEARERETYLRRAYKREKFPKPRTNLGFAKDLPSDEMEKLMLAGEAVGDDDLRQLALARSEAVKAYLTGPGGVEPARVFVLEPGPGPAAAKAEARASRVDFSLK